MLIAMTGLTKRAALRPATENQHPAIRPQLAFQLYSKAGARLNCSDEGWLMLLVTPFVFPLCPEKWVRFPCAYRASKASAHFCASVYSNPNTPIKVAPGYALPAVPCPPPYTLNPLTC